jgi:hypothetical protein
MSQGNSLNSYLKTNKNVILFFTKTENRRAKQVLSGSWYQSEEGGCGDSVWEGEYAVNTVYTCMQMEK